MSMVNTSAVTCTSVYCVKGHTALPNDLKSILQRLQTLTKIAKLAIFLRLVLFQNTFQGECSENRWNNQNSLFERVAKDNLLSKRISQYHFDLHLKKPQDSWKSVTLVTQELGTLLHSMDHELLCKKEW